MLFVSLSFKMSLATNIYAYIHKIDLLSPPLAYYERKGGVFFFILSLFSWRDLKKKGLTRFHIDIVYLKDPYYIYSTAGMGHLRKGEEYM